MGVNIWTEEEDDLLRRCAAQGQSAQEAAALLGDLFGIGRTRMAVLGRANRKGIIFQGQIKHNRRQAAAAVARQATKPKRPTPETAILVAGLMRKRTPIRVEQERAQPAETAAQAPVVDTVTPETAGDNPGVLFLERGALQCAWPQAGWDEASIREKRVCGRPVMMRPGPYGAEPASWCRDCRTLAYQPGQPRKLDATFHTRMDRSVRAA